MSKVSLHYLKREIKNIEQNPKSLGRSGWIGRWQTTKFSIVAIWHRNTVVVLSLETKMVSYSSTVFQYSTGSWQSTLLNWRQDHRRFWGYQSSYFLLKFVLDHQSTYVNLNDLQTIEDFGVIFNHFGSSKTILPFENIFGQNSQKIPRNSQR